MKFLSFLLKFPLAVLFLCKKRKTNISTKYQFKHSIDETQTLNKNQNWPFQLDNSIQTIQSAQPAPRAGDQTAPPLCYYIK